MAAIPAQPDQVRRYEYEYERNGRANRWSVGGSDQRQKVDFAPGMKDLVDVHFPEAERIRVVQDNLTTHSAGALYAAFEPEDARRILRKLALHYTPQQGSWLNRVEIEIAVR